MGRKDTPVSEPEALPLGEAESGNYLDAIVITKSSRVVWDALVVATGTQDRERRISHFLVDAAGARAVGRGVPMVYTPWLDR